MSTPWFLSNLGLDATAGERDIKRAYALRLKAIDPAADPGAFDTLRRAYELARDFAARGGALAEQPIEPPPANPTPAARPDPGPAPRPAHHVPPLPPAPPPHVLGQRMLDRFCARVHAADDADIERELAACVAELGLQQPDAAHAFEVGLVDRLAAGGMRQRAAVFRVALAHFAWNELSHFRRLGALGAWVEVVTQQHHALLQLHDGRRLLTVLAAIAGGAPLGAHAGAWPLARAALTAQPQFMALYLTDDQAASWARLHVTRQPVVPNRARQPGNWLRQLYIVGIVLAVAFTVLGALLSPGSPGSR